MTALTDIRFGLVWFGLVWFDSISTVVGYLMSNSFCAYTLKI